MRTKRQTCIKPILTLFCTRGQGCPLNAPNSVRCYCMGNSNLKPETSINKEIGLEFNKTAGRLRLLISIMRIAIKS